MRDVERFDDGIEVGKLIEILEKLREKFGSNAKVEIGYDSISRPVSSVYCWQEENERSVIIVSED